MTEEEEKLRYENFAENIRKNPWVIIATAFALVYATSEICQWFLIGPSWFRWYAGAIGFSSSWGLCLSSYFGARIIGCQIVAFLVQVMWEIGQYPVGHFDPNDMLLAVIGTALVLSLAYDFRTKRFSALAVSEL